MARKSAEISQQSITIWLGEKGQASALEIATGTEIPYQTVIRNLLFLEQKGIVENSNPARTRNIRWQLTGASTKMPYIKDDKGNLKPVTEIWKAVVKRVKETQEPINTVRGSASIGICWIISAAIYESLGESSNARQALTMGRQELIKARIKAQQDFDWIDRLCKEDRLNPAKPNELIKSILQDEKHTVDIGTMREEMFMLRKVYKT